MTFNRIELFQYQLPLIKPLKMMGQETTVRSGLIIRIIDKSNYAGLGEIAPFPGLHSENLPQAKDQLILLVKRLKNERLSSGLTGLTGLMEALSSEKVLYPSVVYGLEMAVLNLQAQRSHKTLAGLFNADYRKTVSINGLLAGTNVEMLEQFSSLVAMGYKAIKIKVGEKAISEEISLIRQISKSLDPLIAIRLDANRAWSLEEAVCFGKGIAGCPVEYIEEPLKNPAGLETFYAQTGLPVALDETVGEISINNFHPSTGTTALILKPSVLGGFTKTRQMAAFAKEHNLKPVISCAFYSGIGLAAAANLVAGIIEEDIPCGLGTYQWLAEDVIKNRFKATNGLIDVDGVYENSKHLKIDGRLTQIM